MAAYYCGQKVFDVTQYGAMADSKTDNIQWAFSNAWKAACEFNGPTSLAIPQGIFFVGPVIFRGPCYNNISNAKIANLTFLDSKGFHMSIQRSSNVTIRNLNISTTENSHNTDGIHISGSNNIDLATLTIGTGDDCISISQGNTNVSISNVACGPGHSISIGSLRKYMNEKNVAGVNVRNCTVSSTSNGIRIKTWHGAPPSEASDITFEGIITENVSNTIIIDQKYSRGITAVMRGTSNKVVAVNFMCSQLVPCENVTLHDINLEFVSSSGSSSITSSLIQNNSSLVQNITSSCLNVKGMALGIQKPATCL
uniref:Exopolygalacturonase clone GBGE184-like n=2 Tax=Elaeis guineensis var. tenera TaxID=51953 RepID=A0A6J0PR26_ELAGV|nr:exopolygalacturonase clone GBGE184-like [Elaeis guineensis]